MPRFPLWRVGRVGLGGGRVWVLFPTWVGGWGGGDPGLTCPPIRRWVGLFVGGGKGQPRASVSLIRKGWVPFRRGKGVDPHSPPSPPPSPLPPSPPPPSPPPAQGLIFCFPTPCLSFPSRKGRPQPRDGPLLGTQTSSFQFPQSKWCNTKWAEAQWGTQWCPPPHTQSGASVSPRSSLAAQHSAHTPLWGFSPHYSHRNPPSFGYGFLINALLKGPTAPLAPSRGN